MFEKIVNGILALLLVFGLLGLVLIYFAALLVGAAVIFAVVISLTLCSAALSIFLALAQIVTAPMWVPIVWFWQRKKKSKKELICG